MCRSHAPLSGGFPPGHLPTACEPGASCEPGGSNQFRALERRYPELNIIFSLRRMETSILAGIVREGGARSGQILCRLKIAQERCWSAVVCTFWLRLPVRRARVCGMILLLN